MKDYCICQAPLIRGINPEYCGICGKDLKPKQTPATLLKAPGIA
jgi:hypothetical protein